MITEPSGIPKIADNVKGDSESFLHDMVVKEIDGRQIMLASYWDGGYVTLDVTNPLKATYIADSDFAAVDEQLVEVTGAARVPEGNAHQAEFSLKNDYILAADEDFSPASLTASYGSDAVAFDANSGDGTRQLDFRTDEVLSGPTTFVGRACPGDQAVPAGDPAVKDVAVVERGVCDFTVKVAAVEAAGGWDAVMIVNRTGSDACEATLGMSVVGGIPAFGVSPRSLAYDLFGLRTTTRTPASRTTPARACSRSRSARRASRQLPGLLRRLGLPAPVRERRRQAEAARHLRHPGGDGPDKATGFGDLSVHEVAFSARKNGTRLRLLLRRWHARLRREQRRDRAEGAPHRRRRQQRLGRPGLRVGGKEYVAASDRDYGVQIFEYAPANAKP